MPIIHGSDYTSNVFTNTVTITKTYTIKTCVYKLTELILNVLASFELKLYDDNDVLVKTVTLVVSGEDYKNWSNDDNFIFTLIERDLNTFF